MLKAGRAKKKKAASQEAVACRWFARCENVAVGVQSHPILGEVPICERCAAWYKKMGGK